MQTMMPLSSCLTRPPSPFLLAPSQSWRKVYTHSFAAGPARRPIIIAMASVPSAGVIQARISVAASTGRLDLSNCGLEEVPHEVFTLRDLEELSLSWNNISHIPDGIENMTNLRHLGLSGNWLTGLPANIGKLHQLESLWVQGNLLQCLPNEIGNLGKLSILNLTGNMLEYIPESVSSLSNLNLLSLSGNKLEHLPSGLGNMVALKILTVNGNFLRSLPTSLQRLSSLKKLSLQGNRIEYLPTNLSGLSSVKELSVADNELLDLPDSIEELKCLESLSLYGNKITQLSNSICSLKQLRSLWLEGNPLCMLPEPLLLASNLKALGVDSNMALAMKLQAGRGKSLQICKVVGTGRSSSLGGYFKLQPSGEVLSDIVVVAFGSAPGVPNWGGVLGRTRAAMLADNKMPAFDVLYVVDSRRSWYTETKSGEECYLAPPLSVSPGDVTNTGFEVKACAKVGAYYQQELHEALKGYKRVIMIGDSMGASAGLLFSPLATSVIAFCPQVDMTASAIRPGRERSWLSTYKQELLSAVLASSARITVHCGSWEHDLYQAKLLPRKVDLVVHKSDSHRLAKELDMQGSLLTIIRNVIEEEMGLVHSLHLSPSGASTSNS
eukprot:c15039_g1_i1 orf=76-1902(+)